MTNLQIDDELAKQLEQAAARHGRTPQDFAEEAIVAHIYGAVNGDPALTDVQKQRIVESIAQLDRGEVVTSEEVDAFFEDWFKELEAR